MGGMLSRNLGWRKTGYPHSLVWLRPCGSQKTKRDMYFLGYGSDYRQGLSDYIQFAGRAPVLPRYILRAEITMEGGSQLRGETKNQITKFKEEKFLLDMFVIGFAVASCSLDF